MTFSIEVEPFVETLPDRADVLDVLLEEEDDEDEEVLEVEADAVLDVLDVLDVLELLLPQAARDTAMQRAELSAMIFFPVLFIDRFSS